MIRGRSLRNPGTGPIGFHNASIAGNQRPACRLRRGRAARGADCALHVMRIWAALLVVLAFAADRIQAQGRTVRVGVYSNAPKIFLDEDGRVAGFFVELLEAIAAAESWRVVYVPCEWSVCLAALDTGQIDLLPDVAYSVERDARYDFHRVPVVESWSRLYARRGAGLDRLADLGGTRVAVLRGSIQEVGFARMVEGYGYAVEIVQTGSLTEAFALAAGGSADAAIANHFFGDYFHDEYGLVSTPIVFEAVTLYYATALGRNADLLEAIDRHLVTWRDEPSSVYYTILSRWTEPAAPQSLPREVVGVILTTLGMLALAIGAILLLRAQVRARTRHLTLANTALQNTQAELRLALEASYAEIAQRERTEAALRESEARYRSLFTNNHAVMLLVDPESGAVVDANPAAAAYYGWSLAELRQMHLSEINTLPAAQLQGVLRLVQQARRNPYRFQHRLANGSIRDVEVYSGPITLGERPLLYGIVHDITERARAERESQAWQALMQTVIKHDPSAIAVLDRDLHFIFVSDRFLEGSDLTEEDIIGKHHYDVFPEMPERVREVHRRALAGEVLREEEDRIVHADGTVDYARWECRPWVQAGGAIGGIVLYTEMITPRKMVEAALRESEARFRSLVEGAPDAIYVQTDHRFAYLNGAALRLFGATSSDQLLGQRVMERFHPAIHTAIRERMHRLNERQERVPALEEIYLRLDGSEVPVEVTAVPIAFEGKNGALVFARDITDREQAEAERRRRSAELETLHQASQQLLAAGLDPEATYAAVHRAVARLMPCEAFAIVLVEESGDVSHAVYLYDQEGRWPDQRLSPGQGLSGYVISRGESVLINNATTDLDVPLVQFGTELSVRSVLGVPFRSDGAVSGALLTETYESGAFTEHHRLLLETLAAQFSSTIRNAYLHQREQAHMHEMSLITSVSASLRTADTRAEMPTVLLDQLLALLDVDGATLELLDAGTGIVRVELGRGVWADATGHEIMPGSGLSAEVLATGQPYLNNDARNDARLFMPGLFGDCTAAAGAPMVAEGQTIGLLWIGSRRRLTGHDLRVLAAVADIAANAILRATLHEQVEAQARQMLQIMETVPQGVLLIDGAGNVLTANPVARRHLAALAPEPLDRLTTLGGQPLHTFLAPPEQGLWHEIRTDTRIYEVIGHPVPGDSGPKHWVMVIHDATQERQVRDQLQQQARLAAVGQLAAGIAHDFNNIMAAIVLYAQLVAGRPGIPPDIKESVDVIREQAYRATDLISQILDFSRRAPLERRPTQLLPLLKEMLRLWERTLPESISVILEHDEQPCWIDADPTRIQQVLMNLATNARDAMPEGGSIRIKLRQVAVEAGAETPIATLAPGEWVRLDFADDGVGMPSDVLAHLFEPFFTTKVRGQGTGLGLAQIHGIVKQHGGEIHVQSAVGHGATFSVYLPALEAPRTPEAKPPEAGTLQSGAGQRILVVEDNAATRSALVESLKMLGYEPLPAANGREALTLCMAQLAGKAEPIDLILSDLTMPEMGGKALAMALRGLGSHVPVVIISGHLREDDSSALRELGHVRYLRKPVDLPDLAQTIAEALIHSR